MGAPYDYEAHAFMSVNGASYKDLGDHRLDTAHRFPSTFVMRILHGQSQVAERQRHLQ